MSWPTLSLTPPVKSPDTPPHTHRTHTPSIDKMLMAASLCTLDWRIRVHKQALGLKWTLAPSPCYAAEPPGPAPGREAKTATCIWNGHSRTLNVPARVCVFVSVCSYREGAAALCICLGACPQKDMGLNEGIHASLCVCVFILSVAMQF